MKKTALFMGLAVLAVSAFAKDACVPCEVVRIVRTVISVPRSYDPNEMSGPAGVGEQRYVRPGEPMDYTIYFENQTNATAAAIKIAVTLPKDENLDWTALRLGEVAFGEHTDATFVEDASARSSQYVLADSGCEVRTTVTEDEEAVTWNLRIWDPNTGDHFPDDFTTGILPPNDPETHCGEGHIRFSVKVKDDAAPGTVVRASASIVFDDNPAIETDPAWWNTVQGMQMVTFDGNGGTPESQTNEYGVGEAYGELPRATRTGSTFSGWWTAPSGGEQVTEATVVPEDAERTLWAHWTPKRYAVTLDRQGGTGGTASVTATYGAAMPGIKVPKRTGYTFGGYFTEKGGKGKKYYTAAGKSARAWKTTGKAKLYAKWTPLAFTVAFDAAGGTGTTAKQSMTYGKSAKLRANGFKRKGYVFLGWAKTKKGAVAYKDGAKVKNLRADGKTTTLYAKWAKKSYAVAFSANGGKGKMAKQKMIYGKAAKLRKNAFKRKGYVFLGWAKTKKGTVAYKNGAKVKNLRTDGKTTRLYAKWAKKSYSVAFHANGGKGTMTKQTMAYGKFAKLKNNAFKRAGYQFSGWAKTKKGAVAYKNGAEVKNLRTDGKTTTLYAVWTKARAAAKSAKWDEKGVGTIAPYLGKEMVEVDDVRGAVGRLGDVCRVEVTASGGENADAVADGDGETAWTADASDGAWVVLAFPEALDVGDIEVVGENLPDGIRFLLSEDAEEWREEVTGRARYVWVAFPASGEPLAVKEIRVVPE